MATEQQPVNHPQVDNTVIAAFFINGKPMAISCLVTSEAPLYLFTKDDRVNGLTFPQGVILVWHRGNEVTKSEAEVVGVRPWKSGFILEVKKTNWVEVDRRVYPRFPLKVPVSLRAVQDVRGSTIFTVFQGETVDISLGGSWLTVDQPVPLGSLVEYSANLGNGEDVKAFALVVHANTERQGIGVEFLDFMGPSKKKLEDMLSKAA